MNELGLDVVENTQINGGIGGVVSCGLLAEVNDFFAQFLQKSVFFFGIKPIWRSVDALTSIVPPQELSSTELVSTA